MSAIERTIEISFRHRVYFTRNVFGVGNKLLQEVIREHRRNGPEPKIVMILDESLHEAQPGLAATIENYFARKQLNLVSPPIILEGGERVKNSFFHVSEIHSLIDRYHVDRHSFLIAVGGGALLDLAGLAAATAHRGIRHIRIPTTTLSQDDSGVGVKNGVNSFGKKNFIGTFAVPYAVINDFDFLASLTPRDKRAGYIEAVKVACIRDARFFSWLEQNASPLRVFEPEAMQTLIFRCAELHMNHIATSGDPFELGSARPLDFGHWAAHKLEQLSDYRIRHGEAVAVGIALDVIYSRRKGYLSSPCAERVLDLIEALGFDIYANELGNVDSAGDFVILKGLEEFREHLGGQLTITLLRNIGEGFEVHEMDDQVVFEAIQELRTRQQHKPLRSTTSIA